MNFTLLNGRYTAGETEQLLKQLVKVKTDFHLHKIDTVHHSEEDIKHSEKRIKELEEELRRALALVRTGSYKHFTLNAKVVIEFVPDYHYA